MVASVGIGVAALVGAGVVVDTGVVVGDGVLEALGVSGVISLQLLRKITRPKATNVICNRVDISNSLPVYRKISLGYKNISWLNLPEVPASRPSICQIDNLS